MTPKQHHVKCSLSSVPTHLFFILDVQEANCSVSQKHRVCNYFARCSGGNGWFTCSPFSGRGEGEGKGECVLFTLCTTFSTGGNTRPQSPRHGENFDVDHALPPSLRVLLKPPCLYLKTTPQWFKFILKRRSPILAHVSRTYRVSMDGLFERIRLDFVLQ